MNDLKCEICKHGPKAGKPRWYKCLQFHDICQDCKETDGNLTCSTCHSDIPNKRCKFRESILKMRSVRFKCSNQARGCNEYLEKRRWKLMKPSVSTDLSNVQMLSVWRKLPFKITVPFELQRKNQIHKIWRENDVVLPSIPKHLQKREFQFVSLAFGMQWNNPF